VTALHRAVALAQVHDVPGPVGEHLNLDVPRGFDATLDEQGAVSEARLRLAPGRTQDRR